MSRIIMMALLVIVIGVSAVSAQSDSLWWAEYYGNPNLAGAPAVALNESTPSHDWGTAGSPGSGISPDFFSARWTTTQTLLAGTYRLDIRADDGVRVYIDGWPYINEWHPSPAQRYSATADLSTGAHTIVVEFYEGGGHAFLQYNLTQILHNPPPVDCFPASRLSDGGQGRVTPGLPNSVRANPSTSSQWLGLIPGSAVFTIISQPVCADGIRWWQVNYNGLIGWTGESQNGVYWVEPVTAPGRASATVNAYYLNVRSGPGVWAPVLVRITRGQAFSVVGRNSATSWLQLNVNGVIGWVNTSYVTAYNLGNVPVTG
jgi:uncharacterized protein YraI